MSKSVKFSRWTHPKNQPKRYITNHQASLSKKCIHFLWLPIHLIQFYEPILQGEKVINTIKNIVIGGHLFRIGAAAIYKIFFLLDNSIYKQLLSALPFYTKYIYRLFRSGVIFWTMFCITWENSGNTSRPPSTLTVYFTNKKCQSKTCYWSIWIKGLP